MELGTSFSDSLNGAMVRAGIIQGPGGTVVVAKGEEDMEVVVVEVEVKKVVILVREELAQV